MTDEVIEVEAVPLEDDEEEGGGAGPAQGSPDELRARLLGALTPLLAGMAIDFVDLVTVGGIGARFGFPIGLVCGWFLGGRLGLTSKARLWLAAGCGVYCLLPGTQVLPLGTLLGFLARFSGVLSPSASKSRGVR